MRMHKGNSRISIAAIGIILATAWTAIAGNSFPTRAQLMEQLKPAYRALQKDPAFQLLKARLIASKGDSQLMDEALEYMPMSPLELMRIDMEIKHYEFMIPPSVLKNHRRWIQLRPNLAREMYGDDYVNNLLKEGAYIPPVEGTPPGAKSATVGPNRDAASTFSSTPEEYQGEIQVVVNPSNANQIVAAANSMHDCGWGPTQGVFYSADGGATWGFTCAPAEADFGMSCETPIMPMTFGSDPAMWFNDTNTVYLEYMLLCGDGILMSLGINPDFAVVVSSSSDGGATWSGKGVVVNSWGTSNLEDKNLYALDRNPTSPHYGNHYTCWDRGNDEKFAYSTDGASTWTEVDLPPASAGTMDLACEMAIQKNGNIHLVFDALTCGETACTNEQMFYTKSTDGGTTWSTPNMVKDFNLVSFSNGNKPGAQDSRGINPFGGIEVDNSGGTCDGNLYAVYSDYENGNTVDNNDVWLSRSTDGGATWSAGIRVNDDGAGGRVQFHPYMMVDQSSGDIFVAWHDARNDAANHAIDYYVARSSNCGLSFETNVQASQPSSEFSNSGISTSNANTADNANANPNQYGEYMGLDVHEGTAYLAWSDSRQFFPGDTGNSQKENVGFTAVTFDTTPVEQSIFINGFESGNTNLWSYTSN